MESHSSSPDGNGGNGLRAHGNGRHENCGSNGQRDERRRDASHFEAMKCLAAAAESTQPLGSQLDRTPKVRHLVIRGHVGQRSFPCLTSCPTDRSRRLSRKLPASGFHVATR